MTPPPPLLIATKNSLPTRRLFFWLPCFLWAITLQNLSVVHASSQASGSHPSFVPTHKTVTTNTTTTAETSHDTTTTTTNNNNNNNSTHGYIVTHESLVYRRWRTVLQRRVVLPNGRTAVFDVVGNRGAGSAVLIFAWNATSQTATILREYNPGCHRVLYGLAAGLVEDSKKHEANVTLAAQCELEEECHLGGGTWHALTSQPLAMDKYASTTAHCFLVIDPTHVSNPRPLDDEEDIEIVRGVTIPQILTWIRSGEFNVVGAFAALLAIQKLQELGEC